MAHLLDRVRIVDEAGSNIGRAVMDGAGKTAYSGNELRPLTCQPLVVSRGLSRSVYVYVIGR